VNAFEAVLRVKPEDTIVRDRIKVCYQKALTSNSNAAAVAPAPTTQSSHTITCAPCPRCPTLPPVQPSSCPPTSSESPEVGSRSDSNNGGGRGSGVGHWIAPLLMVSTATMAMALLCRHQRGKKHHKSICGPAAPLAHDFVKNIDWIDKDKIDEMYTCASASIQNMIYIANSVPSDDQIPQSCCSYWLSRSCMTNKLKTLTTDAKRVFLEKMTDDAMTNLIEFLCSKQNSVQTCKSIMPEPMVRMEKSFKDAKKGDRRKSESYLMPFLDVISEEGPKH